MAEFDATQRQEVPALKVQQWLEEWEHVRFESKAHRSRPNDHFYLFSLPAADLKALTGIQRRSTEKGLPRSQDTGIQRRHEERRSIEIFDFVRFGYPWSDLSKAKRESGKFDDLRKPGWLPTAIVVNILGPRDRRRKRQVAKEDLIEILDPKDSNMATIRMPTSFTGSAWEPTELHPIEVIDGQHRLWAFEETTCLGNYELPVVAFHGLDISWQAYLFWTINIRPKRINASLAYDLYPLLRTEDWLQRFEGHYVYRETRAQELVETLWSHPDSPWYQHINMLGEPGLREAMVSQAAWVRSLTSTYVKAFEGRRVKIGGLFGAPIGSDRIALPWSRAQQAAFLIGMGQCVRDAVTECDEMWAEKLRQEAESQSPKDTETHDPAFYGSHTLLNTDQGVRGLLHVTNDLCYVRLRELDLEGWVLEEDVGDVGEKALRDALSSLSKLDVAAYLKDIGRCLAAYDWRTSAAEGLDYETRLRKAAFRGAGGYKELRVDLLRCLRSEPGVIQKAATKVIKALGVKYDEAH